MFRHSLLIILRTFKRFKSSFLINLVGLSTGLACALFVYLWVNDELQVDKFHTNDARLFELFEFQSNSENNTRVTNSTPGMLSETIAAEFPEVETAVTATPSYWFSKYTLSVGETIVEATGIYAGRDYFRMFSFPLLAGDPAKVLADKNSIVITESVAKALFNTTENLIGKTIEFQREREFIISGVAANPPSNSSQYFDIVMSTEFFKEQSPNSFEWANSGPMTLVLLKEGANVDAFNNKISNIISKHVKDTHRKVFARKFSDIYLRGNYNDKGEMAGGRIEYVAMFSLIAGFILLIACINFMNLSTAKASRRIKEVGIKKAIGANRRLLILQYMGESMLMSFISLLLAVLLVDLLLPQFNSLTGKQLTINIDPFVALGFVVITFVTGLIAGSYPALYLSGFNPAVVLKGNFNSTFGELMARKGLVVFQFTLSVIFIVSVLVIYNQIRFLQEKNIGYDKENLVYFQIEGKIQTSREAFLSELRNVRGVVGASSISESLVGGGNTATADWEGKNPDDRTPFLIRPVNYGMLDLLGFTLLEGRYFERERQDSLNVVMNEKAIEVMGMKDPIGKTIKLGPVTSTIVGVVKDFNVESLKVGIQPLIFIVAPPYTQQIMVKVAKTDVPHTLENIGRFYKQFNPDFTFDYRFLDQDYQAQYDAEQRVSTLSKYFAGMAILISCLGLFGLATFTAERRRKEIGIRKALGSSNSGIVILLSSDFTKIVLIAIAIALPISWIVLNQWLTSFAYKIPLAWWYFIGAGGIALVISWITVATQATRASRINPVECLRSE